MKTHRSTKVSTRFATAAKRHRLRAFLDEYGRAVNAYIDLFWEQPPAKKDLLKPVIDQVESWLPYGVLQGGAAREAVDMVKMAKVGKQAKPRHNGKKAHLFGNTCSFRSAKVADTFDCWLHIPTVGKIPIKLHKHFHRLAAKGTLRQSFVVRSKDIGLCFEVETGPKREVRSAIGVDTGINALATTSDGAAYGTGVRARLDRMDRCKQGSKGYERARRDLKHYIDATAKEVASQADAIVVERLKGITKKTKSGRRRLPRSMRRSIGRWGVRYWLARLQQRTEDYRVVFRSVPGAYTSQTCPSCGHVDRNNRRATVFRCQSCGCAGHADVLAALNILRRSLSGAYPPGCQSVA